ncbi:uncharacterized protein [Euwallacea fornicatus]|uniref:uncharacterized protein isoform X2 n=1 Tax=Euwallacea fornicatus TaxID=995702 RepID=UPI0033906A1C
MPNVVSTMFGTIGATETDQKPDDEESETSSELNSLERQALPSPKLNKDASLENLLKQKITVKLNRLEKKMKKLHVFKVTNLRRTLELKTVPMRNQKMQHLVNQKKVYF